MRSGTLIVVSAVAIGLFVTGAAAQHEEHHPDQGSPQAGKTDSKAGKMMAGNMMPQMMMGQNDTGELVDRLLKSFAAIEAEKDPAAFRDKLSEHGALLKELQTKVQAQSHMMEMMQHMMGGSMMGGPTAGGDSKK